MISRFIKFFQEKVIFLPKKLPQNFSYEFEKDFEELFFETPLNGKINAIFFRNEKPKGVILYFHGNADHMQRWGKYAAEFTQFGYDVFIYDYRGYGKSQGEKTEKNLFSDAQYFYDFLKKKYGENNLIVYGRSLGGAFATKIASDNHPKLVILESTFYNLQNMAARHLPNRFTQIISGSMHYHFQSNHFIKKITSPLYFFHGNKDRIVPLKSGKKLFSEFEKHQSNIQKKFIELENGTHNNLSKFDYYQETLKEILN